MDLRSVTNIRPKDLESVMTLEGGELLTVCFEDGAGRAYRWCPKWEDLRCIVREAVIVESVNQTEVVQEPRGVLVRGRLSTELRLFRKFFLEMAGMVKKN